jgi:hypothetical protein
MKFAIRKYNIIFSIRHHRGIFRKWEGIVGTGWSGLRIGTSG